MLDDLHSWWQSAAPEAPAALQFGGVVFSALLAGHVLGLLAARGLAARNFDAALRMPGSSPPDPEAGHGFTPTFVAGLLVRLTVWGGAAWWLAQKHGRADLAHTLGVVINRAWAVAAILVASLALGSLLANRLIACLGGLPKAGAPAAPARGGAAAPRWDVAGAVGAGAYVLVLLLVLLVAADLFDWPLTRASALALWEFAQHLLVASAALFIGGLGAGWARDLAAPEGAASPESRAGQYTALGIVAASTVLAVAVLLSTAGVLFGLAALALLGLLLWLVRGYLPDVTAGLQLRAHKVTQVCVDGEPWQVVEVGLLAAQLTRRGEFCRLPNRQVLEARLHGAAPEAVPR